MVDTQGKEEENRLNLVLPFFFVVVNWRSLLPKKNFRATNAKAIRQTKPQTTWNMNGKTVFRACSVMSDFYLKLVQFVWVCVCVKMRYTSQSHKQRASERTDKRLCISFGSQTENKTYNSKRKRKLFSKLNRHWKHWQGNEQCHCKQNIKVFLCKYTANCWLYQEIVYLGMCLINAGVYRMRNKGGEFANLQVSRRIWMGMANLWSQSYH